MVARSIDYAVLLNRYYLNNWSLQNYLHKNNSITCTKTTLNLSNRTDTLVLWGPTNTVYFPDEVWGGLNPLRPIWMQIHTRWGKDGPRVCPGNVLCPKHAREQPEEQIMGPICRLSGSQSMNARMHERTDTVSLESFHNRMCGCSNQH